MPQVCLRIALLIALSAVCYGLFPIHQGYPDTDAGVPSEASAASEPDASSIIDRGTADRNGDSGQHAFDFEIGTWRTHLSRLRNPLSGSTTWLEYEGTSVVRKVWNGRANLVELDVTGPAGGIEGLSLRLYNPESRQWSLHFASSRDGLMTAPVIGEFRNGRGEFYGQETLDGRAIYVRFVISRITTDSWRFEQSFSDDGGRTWEVNWIAVDTRVPAQPDVQGSVDR